MLPTNARRKIIDPVRFTLELLEERLLFAVDSAVMTSSIPGQVVATVTGPLSGASIVTDDSVDPSASIDTVTMSSAASSSPTAIDDSTTTSTSTTSTLPTSPGLVAPVEQVDTYLLPAGVATPAIHAELDWIVGSSSTSGNLILSDASGNILLDAPVIRGTTLQRLISVGGTAANSTVNWLDLTLTVQPNSNGSADSGSYQLELQWLLTPLAENELAAAPVGSVNPAGVSTTPNSPSSSCAPILPPGLSISRSLPTGAFFAGAAQLPPPNPAGIVSTPPNFPVLGGPNLISGPGAPVVSGSGHPITDVGPRTAFESITLSPAQNGYLIPGDRGNPLTLGPLPLGVSAPDGGIFTRTRVEVTLTPPGRGQFGLTPKTLLMFSLQPLTTIEGRPAAAEAWPRGLDRDLWFDQFAFSTQTRLTRTLTAVDEAFADPISAGMAFLPPIEAMAGADRPDPTPQESAQSRESRRGQRGNSIMGTLVAIAGAIGLVLKISGPEVIRSLRD